MITKVNLKERLSVFLPACLRLFKRSTRGYPLGEALMESSLNISSFFKDMHAKIFLYTLLSFGARQAPGE